MFNEKDILARLQNGEDAQKIADEMAAILNAANKTYTDQKEAEKKAAADCEWLGGVSWEVSTLVQPF